MKGITLKSADRSSFSEAQKQLDEAVQELSRATGLSFVLFDGTEGGRINGVYRSGGTIYVNIRTADKSAKMIAGQVLSHELTHFIKEFAPEEYETLKKYIIKELIAADNHSFEEAVAQKQAREPGISYDEAVDEVIADGCETMLKSSEAIRRLCAENRTLGQKIQEFFAWIVEKLEKIFGDAEPTHIEAKILQNAKDAQRLWDLGMEAAAGALKNARGMSTEAQKTAQKNTADEGGEFDLSVEDGTEPYDYRKPFEQQIEDYLNGIIPEDDTLFMYLNLLQKQAASPAACAVISPRDSISALQCRDAMHR